MGDTHLQKYAKPWEALDVDKVADPRIPLPPCNHSVFCSDGYSMRMPAELYDEYQQRGRDLQLEFYGRVRDKYGIWASNQNKFVSDASELREWDSKFMETKYAEYLQRKANAAHS